MLLASTATVVEPTISLGALGIIVTIVGAACTGSYVVIKSTALLQRAFDQLKTDLEVLKRDNDGQNVKISKIEDKMENYTEILSELKLITSRQTQHDRDLDRFHAQVQGLVNKLADAEIGRSVAHRAKRNQEEE